jgi:MFS family permease
MIKDVIRLKWHGQLSHEQIASTPKVSKGVVAKYVSLASAAGLDWETVQDWSEKRLGSVLMPRSATAQPFFGPTLVKEAGFTSPLAVGWIMAAAYLCGAAGMILNGFHSDKHQESRYHCGLAAAVGSAALLVIALVLRDSPALTLAALTLAIVGTMSAIPVFWQIPNRFLSGTAAAGGVALINSVANLAGFGAPFMLGHIKTATGSLSAGLFVVAAVEICGLLLIVAFIPRFGKAAAGKATFH